MSNEGERRQQQQQPHHEHGFAIDIRWFLLVITLSMGASFYAGVAYGPIEFAPLSPPVRSTNGVPQQDSAATLARTSSLPKSGGGGEEHLPAGQHLLVDLKGMDSDFLNSEERLSKAMVEVVRETGLTLLSYHCHALTPTGVSCVGVLLESHISFHTWPEDGVITLDLFTCGSKPLLPAVEVMERLFGIPAEEGGKVRSRWSHELRGFRSDEAKKKNYLDGSSDLSLWVLSPMEMYSKDQIYSNLTKYVLGVDLQALRRVAVALRFSSLRSSFRFAGSSALTFGTFGRPPTSPPTPTCSSTTCRPAIPAFQVPSMRPPTVSFSWTGPSKAWRRARWCTTRRWSTQPCLRTPIPRRW